MSDGLEERLDAFNYEMLLRRNPEVKRRKEAYDASVSRARAFAASMSQEAVIDALTAHNPAYIRSLLETEDSRLGEGSINERYARTFYKRFGDA